MSARFGPAGNSDSFSKTHKSSLDAPGWIADFGLDCYEYQCGKGVRVSRTMAEEIGRYYRLLWPGTPSEAFGIRLKITFDENGNDWNYFKIFIPLEEK